LVARTIFQAGRSPRSLAGLHRNDLCMTAATPLTTGRDDRSIRLTGIALMLAGTGLFSFNDALGKYLVATYSVGQLLLLRAFVALVLLSPFVWRARAEFKAIPRPGLQLLRVVLAASEVAAFFFATIYLPLADVITFYLRHRAVGAGARRTCRLAALERGRHRLLRRPDCAEAVGANCDLAGVDRARR
jgi:hypothetical protein